MACPITGTTPTNFVPKKAAAFPNNPPFTTPQATILFPKESKPLVIPDFAIFPEKDLVAKDSVAPTIVFPMPCLVISATMFLTTFVPPSLSNSSPVIFSLIIPTPYVRHLAWVFLFLYP